MLRRVFLVGFQGVPSPLGGEVLFVLEIIRGVLQARAKGVPLGVSLVGTHPSPVGVHHPKFLFNHHQITTAFLSVRHHLLLCTHLHRTPPPSLLNDMILIFATVVYHSTLIISFVFLISVMSRESAYCWRMIYVRHISQVL